MPLLIHKYNLEKYIVMANLAVVGRVSQQKSNIYYFLKGTRLSFDNLCRDKYDIGLSTAITFRRLFPNNWPANAVSCLTVVKARRVNLATRALRKRCFLVDVIPSPLIT